MKPVIVACMLASLMPGVCLAQSPMGIVGGVVRDPSGAAVVAATVRAVSATTGQMRATTTAERGEYSFPALLPGQYQISVEAAGFERIAGAAIVHAGTTTRADLALRVGVLSDLLVVHAASPQIQHDSAGIGGVVVREQIEDLPLNGRNFLELAKLEPGLQPPAGANRNRTVVPVLGAPAANVGGARFTVDGGSVTAVGLGGSQMGFSQELVQEFQVSTVNFDLSTGMTDAGAINVVTRGGGNERRATAFYFFRDHNLAAYPTLQRDPNNPDPFFQRQQFGFALGGPIGRDRLFYFGAWEESDQRAVGATTLLAPEFIHLSRNTASPLTGHLSSLRVDAKIANAHTLFVRHSRDGSRGFGAAAAIGGGSPNAYPSNWSHVVTRADQSLVALTSVLRPTVVNDLRFSSFYVRSRIGGADEDDCPGCLGIGAPSISVPQAGLVIGNSASLDNLERRYQLNDSVTWQRRAHRVRVGVNWEHNRDRNRVWNNEPVAITLFSPSQVRSYNSQAGVLPAQRIPLPTTFLTVEEILQLPLQTITVGVGAPGVPQENGSDVRTWNTLWLYAEDAWRLHERVTLTYGLGWGYDGMLNHDLRKPALLEPILGADGLGPTRKNWTNLSPALGMAWTPSVDSKTVVRAGAGRFHRQHGLTSSLDAERVALGPPGLGRTNRPGSSIFNSIPNLPGLAVGAPLEFRTTPTRFTGADMLVILPAIRSALAESLAGGDPSVQQIQITKQASPAIFPVDVPNPTAVHGHVGVQRELVGGMALSADAVYRHFTHVPQNGGSVDVNHYNSVRGAVVPRCTAAQRNDPHAVCSLGPINVQTVPYRFTYKGLLLRLEKRLSNGFHVLGSYAYSRNSGTNAGNGFNLENWLENRGPAGVDFTHILNVAGAVRLPAQVHLGFNFSHSSVPPFSAYVSGIDFNGDGTQGDLLPGTTVNAFNRGMDRGDLEQLVAGFNETYAGTRDAQNAVIPHLALPARYAFGDNLHSLDLRLSRSLVLRQHVRVSIIGEAFNVYNAANLSGHTGDLTSGAFGQPTSRVTQVFGSSGPRAFQLATRVSF